MDQVETNHAFENSNEMCEHIKALKDTETMQCAPG